MKLIESLAISPKVIKAALALGVTGILVTAGGSVAFAENVATTISLDVNPSIEITANESDEVIEVTALNEDAETVLGHMDLEDVDLDVAMNAIVGSMVQNGYLDETKNAVLITVDNEDEAKQQELEALITTEITDTLAEDDITPAVFTQDAASKGASGTNVKAFAKEYGISVNKAAFIKKILRENDGFSEKELVGMNVEALSDVIHSKNIDLHDSVGYSDEDLTKDAEKAAEKATGNQADAVAKATEKQANASVKATEAQVKATEKQAAAETQSTEKQAEATIKAEEAQAQAVEKQAAADAKATEKQAEADAKAAEAQIQAAEKQATAEAKAAEQQAQADAKQAEAAVKAAEAEAKAYEAQVQAAQKQSEAEAKAAEKQAEANAKANTTEKQANGNSAASGKKGATSVN